MCGRFVRASTVAAIAEEFDADSSGVDLGPSYNVAPSQDVILIINDGNRRLLKCRWGFVPPWSRDPAIGHKMINARAETVADKPSYRSAFKKQRGLIIADGFYEWRKRGKDKIPYYARLRSNRPFGFAGLYNVWTSPANEELCTCTVITVQANSLLRPIHDRMPVIIPKDTHDIWLSPDTHDRTILLPLLNSYASEEMEAYEVSRRVNSPSFDSPENIMPSSGPEPDHI